MTKSETDPRIALVTKGFMIGGAILALIFLLSVGGNFFENVDANEILVVQYVSGKLETFTTPGWKPQNFGKVTKYQKRKNFDFTGSKDSPPIRVRFNDGGHADMQGSFAYEMPLTKEQILTLHMKYGSQEGVEDQLIRPSAERSIYMTGPLMSSTESYAVRRPDLLTYVEDQLQRGVYRTRKIDTKAPDPITGEEKTVSIVEIVADEKGVLSRQEKSPIGEFGIKVFNLSFKEIAYDPTVEKQIETQQQFSMRVQTAIAEAKQAEQNRITTEQNGMAAAAKAKWDQEVIKATAVTEAQQNLAVAELDRKTAEQEKAAMILRGEGEGASRRAKIAGDNALDQRLAAWVEVEKARAEALAKTTVPWTAQVITGGGSGSTNGQQLLEIMGVKAAKDLALDMSMSASKQK